MTGEEIVDRVAANIRTGFGPSAHQETARAAVLATLEAIREPSEEMMELAVGDSDGAWWLPERCEKVWRAMIDALKREVAG